MTKQYVKWKPVTDKNVRGADYKSELPEVLDIRHRGTLLAQITSMAIKKPISFDQAVRMLSAKMAEAANAKKLGYEMGHYDWYISHFIAWISESGYHIELTGDEFESPATPDKVA